MPPYSNPVALKIDGLDDPLIFDMCRSFVGGMVSNARANLLNEDQASFLQNCEISRNGEITTRRGSTRLGASTAGTGTYVQGMAFYETPSFNYPVVANGTKLYSYDGANWNLFGNTFTASGAGNRVGFAQGVDKLYLAELGLGHLFSWDGTTLTDLSNVGGTTNTNPPASPTYLAWHTNRLVCVGGPTLPDTLFFSQFLDATVWDNAKWSLRVGAGEGDAITGIYPWSDFNLIVLKRHSIWVVNCDPQTQITDAGNTIAGFPVKPIHRRVGCVAPMTASQVGSDVFFLSDSGVRSVKRVQASETQTESSEALSLPVQDIILRINQAAVATSCAIFYDNKYMLAVPLDNATAPNYLLVYDVLNQSWSGLWTGWLPTAFAIRNITSEFGRLIFGQSDGTVNEFLSYVQPANETDAAFQDNAVDIPVQIKTRAMSFGEPILRKEGFNCELEFNRSTAVAEVEALVDADADTDAQTFETLQTGVATVTLPQVLPFILPTAGVVRAARDLQRYGLWREIIFRVTTTAQKLVLRSISASAFLNPMEIQRG